MSELDLDRALRLKPSGEGIWTANADPNYEAGNGMFGGWTAALALQAVSKSAAGAATPCVITVNFVNKIEAGTNLFIRSHRVGGGRSVSYWQVELMSEDQHTPLSVASVVLTQRRNSDENLDVSMPKVPAPETLEVVHPAPGTNGERCAMRPIEGFPFFGRTTTYSTAWVRETSGRSVDHMQLAFLADFRAPRSYFWSDGPRPSATLSLSVYFHATVEELGGVGDDDLLSEAFGVRGVQSTSEEHLRLWSRSGALLASSIQMAWYR